MIHDDYAHYPWFYGKWLAKLIYDISMIGIEMKHLPVWNLYTFERFFSVWLNPVFPLMFFRNKMWNDLNLILGYENSILVLSFLIVVFLEKCCADRFWGLVLYQACSYLLKHICFVLVRLSFIFFSSKWWNKGLNVFCL